MTFMIKEGTPVDRQASDGGFLTDTPGTQERVNRGYIIYDEAVLLTPDKNNGKWLFAMSSELLWEIEKEYVTSGARRQFHQ